MLIALYLSMAGAGINSPSAPGQPVSVSQPSVAPVPVWVRQRVVPLLQDNTATGATKALLRDQQVSFDPNGTMTVYWDDATRVTSPEGLATVANVALAWNPDTDSLTVHRLRILRGDRDIDLLKTQKFTTLRRETNLERAAIDGQLTASLQIDGLLVGDVVEIAASRKHRDPALGCHHEAILAVRPGAVDNAVEARWNAGLVVQAREMPNLPPLRKTQVGDVVGVSLYVRNLQDPILPKQAPPAYRQADVIQFSDWSSWSQLSALMAPLYDKASIIAAGGPVAREVAKIAATTGNPVSRAEAALALVQDQVRYLFVGLDGGGYVPTSADITWQRRFGDCKGKTALLLGVLHELGIEAQPVLVNTGAFGGAIPEYLPAAGLFNHVLVRARIAGRTYWLDGTHQGDRHLEMIDVPALHWGLPIQPAAATLVPIMPGPATRPLRVTTMRIDASAGPNQPAPVHGDLVVRGDAAQQMRRTFAALTPNARNQLLKDIWRRNYDSVQPETVSARFDPDSGSETVSVDGVAKLDWIDGAYELTLMQIGEMVDFVRDPGPGADAPFAIPYPFSDVRREQIILPNGGTGFRLDPMAFDARIAGVQWHRVGSLANGVGTFELTADAVEPEFPASEAAGAQEELRHLSHQHVFLREDKASRTR